jgi:hypothetical protein
VDDDQQQKTQQQQQQQDGQQQQPQSAEQQQQQQQQSPAAGSDQQQLGLLGGVETQWGELVHTYIAPPVTGRMFPSFGELALLYGELGDAHHITRRNLLVNLLVFWFYSLAVTLLY